MSGTIYLIGGGEISNGETRLIDEDILSLRPRGSNFVFIGFAAQDSTSYAATITAVFGGRYNVVIPTKAKGKDFAIDALKSAAFIYLGGGNTDQLLRVSAEWGLSKHLQAAIDRGVHVAGMSAGAQALSAWYAHEDNDIYDLREGLGIVPLGVLVHANQASFDNATLLRSNNEIAGSYPFIGIGEGSAWRLDNSKAQKIGSGKIWILSAQNDGVSS